MSTAKGSIFEAIGLVRFEGKWITRYKARKLLEALTIMELPEAHQKAIELGVQLQKHYQKKKAKY